jgi:hypothetical protein
MGQRNTMGDDTALKIKANTPGDALIGKNTAQARLDNFGLEAL